MDNGKLEGICQKFDHNKL